MLSSISFAEITLAFEDDGTSEKENSWSEDEMDTGTTTEANEPIEVDNDVSHEASENKEQ
jgi:hypothetical protein